MPITTPCKEETPGAFPVPYVRHLSGCQESYYNRTSPAGCKCDCPRETTYAVESAHGLVIEVYTKEYRIMSDVWGTMQYALVWDPKKCAPVEKAVHLMDHLNANPSGTEGAVVDATEFVREELGAFRVEEARRRCELEDTRRKKRAAQEKKAELEMLGPPEVRERGARVEVIRGRKAPKGTIGTVRVYMKSKYGDEYIVRLEEDNGTGHWIRAAYCQAAPVVTTEELVARENEGWDCPF